MQTLEKVNPANVPIRGPVEQVPAVLSETATMISMFERLARDPSVPMERIESVMDLLGQLRKEQAEETFNDALAMAQQEMTPIARDSFNPQTKSKYASYAAIDKAVRPIRTKYGLGVSFDEGDGAPVDHIRVYAFVTKGRHRQTYHYDSPIITKGIRGGDMMTLTHARASAVTYAKRYLMGMIFDLSTGEDADGNTTTRETEDYTPPAGSISAEQVDQLRELMESLDVKPRAFLSWAKQKRIEDIPAESFDACIAGIKHAGGAQQ